MKKKLVFAPFAAHHERDRVHLQGMANVQLVLDKNAIMPPSGSGEQPPGAVYHSNPSFTPDTAEPRK